MFLNIIYIYALTEPNNEFEIRYIGKSNKPKIRYESHLYESKHLIRDNKNGNHRQNWIKKLLLNNEKPKLVIIEECTIHNWAEEEKYWIKYYKDWGYDLINETEGGEGAYGYIRSEETRKKLSLVNLGRKQSPEVIKKRMETCKLRGFEIGKVNIGRKQSLEEIKKRTQFLIGNKHTLGYKHTDEWKQDQSERMKGKKYSLGRKTPKEELIKMSLALKGKPWSKARRDAYEKSNKCGRKWTEQERKNFSLKKKGVPWSENRRRLYEAKKQGNQLQKTG